MNVDILQSISAFSQRDLGRSQKPESMLKFEVDISSM